MKLASRPDFVDNALPSLVVLTAAAGAHLTREGHLEISNPMAEAINSLKIYIIVRRLTAINKRGRDSRPPQQCVQWGAALDLPIHDDYIYIHYTIMLWRLNRRV